MYKDFFGFTSAAFGVAPDARFFYDNGVHRATLARLRHAIESRNGLIVVTGDAGTGKTILLRKVTQDLGDGARAASLFDPLIDFEQLLRLTLSALGLRNFAVDRLTMMNRLNRYLNEQRLAGHVVCLIIDEAQDCSVEMLNELRQLSNLETESDKLLQIVLVGQCTLERYLDRPELLQFRQRIALRCRLDPLPLSEVQGYIAFRLRLAGYHGQPLFDIASIELIAHYSQGIPRLVNILCDHALETACMAGASQVNRTMIDKVARDLALVSTGGQLNNATTLVDWQLRREQRHDMLDAADGGKQELPAPRQEFNFDSDYSLVDADGRPIGSDRHRRWLGVGMAAMLMIAVGAVVLAPLLYPEQAHYSLATLMQTLFPSHIIEMPVATQSPQPDNVIDKALEPTNLPETPDLTLTREKGDGPTVATAPANNAAQTPERSMTVPAREDKAPVAKHVGPAPTRVSPPPSSSNLGRHVGHAQDDLEVRVAKAVHDRAIEGVEISVRNGFVILGGRVATLRQKLVAGRAARSVAGTEFVRNDIVVDSNAAQPIQ